MTEPDSPFDATSLANKLRSRSRQRWELAGFRESAVLERYVDERLPARAIAWGERESGAWVERLDALFAEPRPAPRFAEGAARAATAIAKFLAAPDTP